MLCILVSNIVRQSVYKQDFNDKLFDNCIWLTVLDNCVGEGGATRSCGAKRFFAILVKPRMAKSFYLAKSCMWQYYKMAQNMAFLDSEIIIVIDFLHVWSNNPSR